MTSHGAAVRWGDGRRADFDFAREQILDAAWRCFQRQTVQKTRMEHIAREAKVSRTTVYRYFQSRDDVLLGVIVRALDDVARHADQHASNASCFAEFLAESLAASVEQAPFIPVLITQLQEATLDLSRNYVVAPEVITLVEKYFHPHFAAAKAAGELREGIQLEEVIDWILHVMSSYALMPSPLSAKVGWRRLFWRYLVPAIVRNEAIPIDKRT